MGNQNKNNDYDFVQYCMELDEILGNNGVSCGSDIDEVKMRDLQDLKLMDEHNLFTYGMESDIDFDMLLLKSRDFKRRVKRV